MTDADHQIEDAESEEPSKEVKQIASKDKSARRRSFSKLRRELSDEESLSPGVQRMLFDEIERLESDCEKAAEYRDNFHVVDKRLGVLEEKFKAKVSVEVVHVACITVGAAALGYAPAIWTASHGWMVLIFGLILVIAGVVAKAVKL